MLHHIGSDNPCRHSLSKRSAPREFQGWTLALAGCRASSLIMSHLRSPWQLTFHPYTNEQGGRNPTIAGKNWRQTFPEPMQLVPLLRHRDIVTRPVMRATRNTRRGFTCNRTPSPTVRPGGRSGALAGCLGCRLHPTPGHRVVQRLEVGLVLVGVALGEGSNRPVEGIATAEVARDRDPVARPCVR